MPPAAAFLYLAATLQKTTAALYYSSNRRTDAELCILRLCDESSLSGDLTALWKPRIQRLEDTLSRGHDPLTVEHAAAAKATPPGRKLPQFPNRRPSLPCRKSVRRFPKSRLFVQNRSSRLTSLRSSVPLQLEHSAPRQPAAAEAPAIGGSWWRALTEACKGRLSPMYRVFLDMCTGVLEGESFVRTGQHHLGRLDNNRVSRERRSQRSLSGRRNPKSVCCLGGEPLRPLQGKSGKSFKIQQSV